MILIPKAVFIACALLFIVLTVGLGYYGYTINEDSAGEWNLYWHLLTAVLALLLFGLMLLRSIRLSRHMDNLITMSRHRGFSPETSMKKLGKIGEKITSLYFEIQAASEKKTLKIASQRNLIDFLSGIVREQILVTDVTGTVLYISRAMSENLEGGKAEHIGKPIEELIPGVSFDRIIGSLFRTHVSTSEEIAGRTITFHPVYNRRTELGYVVASYDKIRIVPVPIAAKPNVSQKVPLQDRLRNILGRK